MSDPERTVAFFDLDHTLLARSSGELYIRVLKEQGLLKRRELVKILVASILYRINLLDPEGLMEKFVLRVAGDSEQEMIDFCNQWFEDTVRHYLYAEAVQRVKEHQSRGHTLAILSAATPYVAGPTARHLGIDQWLCTQLEVSDGRFTGRIVKPICHGRGKLFWAERFCRERGSELGRSYFYTDSIRDLPVLERVGHPVPVNPDFFLRRAARQRGWKIEVFRQRLS